MNENETTEKTEVVTPIEEPIADMSHLENLEAMKSFDDMAKGRGEEATETETPDDAEEPAEATEEPADNDAPEVETEVETEASAPFLVLSDGTGVTKEEAVAGYTRHLDYTQKTMELSEKSKEQESYSFIIEQMKTDPALFDMVDKHIRGKAQKQAAQPDAELTVPENYKDDPWVKDQVALNNKLLARVNALEGGVATTKQEATEKEQHGEAQAVYHQRLKGAFDNLKGQLGADLSPDDFVNKMNKHFEGKGLTPEQYMPMIIGPDSTYFSANVGEAYRDDIGKVVKDKVSSEREKRKPKGADKRALKAKGKPPKTVSQKSPRLADGKLDRKKFFRESPVQQLSGKDVG